MNIVSAMTQFDCRRFKGAFQVLMILGETTLFHHSFLKIH